MSDHSAPDRSRRWRLLLDAVARTGRLSVADAAAEFGVSAATVRRDFAALAEQQLVSRTHGGVVATSVAYDLPLRYREDRKSGELEALGACAAQIPAADSVVGFTGGLVTSAVARHLALREDLSTDRGQPGITVLTNALNIAVELVLRQQIRTVTLGGVARPNAYELVGPQALTVLDQFWMDTLFLGVERFSVQGGATLRYADEAGIGRAMVERAGEVVVVTPSGSLGGQAFIRVCDATQVRMVVTDDGVSAETKEEIEGAGVEVRVARGD